MVILMLFMVIILDLNVITAAKDSYNCAHSANHCMMICKDNDDTTCIFTVFVSTNDTMIRCEMTDELHPNSTTATTECVLTCESETCTESILTCDQTIDAYEYNLDCICNGNDCPTSTKITTAANNHADISASIGVDDSILLVFFIAFCSVILCCFCILIYALFMCGLYYGEKKKGNNMSHNINRQLQDLMKLKDPQASFVSSMENEKSDATVNTHGISYLSTTGSGSHHNIFPDDEKDHEMLIKDTSNTSHHAQNSSIKMAHYLPAPARQSLKRPQVHLIEESSVNAMNIVIDHESSEHKNDQCQLELKQQESDGMSSQQQEGVYKPKMANFDSEDLYSPKFGHMNETLSDEKKDNDELDSDDDCIPHPVDGKETNLHSKSLNLVTLAIASRDNHGNNNEHERNDSSSQSVSTLTLNTQYTMDGHLPLHHFTHKQLADIPQPIFVANNSNQKSVEEIEDDLMEDISATLPRSPEQEPQQSKYGKITKHPPKESLLRPPTAGGGGKMKRRSSFPPKQVAVKPSSVDEARPNSPNFVISPRALSPTETENNHDKENEGDEDEEEKASQPTDHDDQSTQNGDSPSNRHQDGNNTSSDDKPPPTSRYNSLTTFAIYDDGDYNDTINPLDHLNTLNNLKRSHLRSDTQDTQFTDLQSESTFTQQSNINFNELSRTTSAAAVHVAFPSQLSNPLEPGKVSNSSNRSKSANFNSKHRNYYSEQFYNFKPNILILDTHNNNNHNTIPINIKRGTPNDPSSTKSTRASSINTIFEVEQLRFTAKTPSSLIPSLPNSPYVEDTTDDDEVNAIDMKQTVYRHHKREGIPPPPPIQETDNELDLERPQFVYEQTSDDKTTRSRNSNKSKKKRSKTKGKRASRKNSNESHESSRSSVGVSHFNRNSNGSEDSKMSKHSRNSNKSNRSNKNKKNRSRSNTAHRRSAIFSNHRKTTEDKEKKYELRIQIDEVHNNNKKGRRYHESVPSLSQSYDSYDQQSPMNMVLMENNGINLMSPQFVREKLSFDDEDNDKSDDDEEDDDMAVFSQHEYFKRARKSTGNITLSETITAKAMAKMLMTPPPPPGLDKLRKAGKLRSGTIGTEHLHFPNIPIVRNIVK